jgi:hypothetical protein
MCLFLLCLVQILTTYSPIYKINGKDFLLLTPLPILDGDLYPSTNKEATRVEEICRIFECLPTHSGYIGAVKSATLRKKKLVIIIIISS